MERSDGPAIDALMRSEPISTSISISTHYLHDPYDSLLAQHPSLFGVVAEARGSPGLAGFGTAFFDTVTIGGSHYPRAQLENLKVRHDLRRRGLGAQLARWRIEEALRQMGGHGLITTGIEAGNAGSLATAAKWSTQVLGPIRIVIARTSSRPPRASDLTVRAPADTEMEGVADAVNAFHAGHNLYPGQTASSLRTLVAPSSIGLVLRQYRVAVAKDGALLAGAVVTQRYALMTDHVDHMPRPVALISRVAPVFPADRVIRMIELSQAWHAPGRVDAGHALWEAIRFEWRDRATHVTGLADPRGSLPDMFRIGPTLMPPLKLMVPVRSPVPLDENRLTYIGR